MSNAIVIMHTFRKRHLEPSIMKLLNKQNRTQQHVHNEQQKNYPIATLF